VEYNILNLYFIIASIKDQNDILLNASYSRICFSNLNGHFWSGWRCAAFLLCSDIGHPIFADKGSNVNNITKMGTIGHAHDGYYFSFMKFCGTPDSTGNLQTITEVTGLEYFI